MEIHIQYIYHIYIEWIYGLEFLRIHDIAQLQISVYKYLLRCIIVFIHLD